MTQAETSSGLGTLGGSAGIEPRRALTVRRESVHFEKVRGVTEVRVDRPVTHVSAYLPADRLAADRLTLLRALAGAGVPIFLVKLLPNGISFAVRADSAAACETLLRERQVEHALLRDLVPIYIVAGAMRDLSGVMAKIFDALNATGVRVEQTGDRYDAVLLLVKGSSAADAAAALQERFKLGDSVVDPNATVPAAAEYGGLKPL